MDANANANPNPNPNAVSVSPIAREIADAISPTFVAEATQHKEEIVHAIGNGIIERNTLRIEYPLFLRGIPPGTVYVVDAILTYLAGRPLKDVATLLTQHMAGKEVRLHHTIRMKAEGSEYTGGDAEIREEDML